LYDGVGADVGDNVGAKVVGANEEGELVGDKVGTAVGSE